MEVGDGTDKRRLGEPMRFIDIAFDKNRFADIETTRSSFVIVDSETAIQRRNARTPRIGKAIEIPEVLVSVDEVHDDSLFSFYAR